MESARGGEKKRRKGQRETPVKRVWPTETGVTGRVIARIPIDMRNRLRKYVEESGLTTTDCIIIAIDEFLHTRGR